MNKSKNHKNMIYIGSFLITSLLCIATWFNFNQDDSKIVKQQTIIYEADFPPMIVIVEPAY